MPEQLSFQFPECEAANEPIYDAVQRARRKRRELSEPERKRMRAEVFQRQKGYCASCGEHWITAGWLEFDHRQALINHGGNCMSNMQLLCERCHNIKTAEDKAIARQRMA